MRVLVLFVFLLVACGGPAPATVAPTVVVPTVAPTANVAGTVEASVKATIAAAPTSTVAPPPTAVPTVAPPSPIAAAKAPLTAEKVIAAFKVAGLEAENPTPYVTREDFGPLPYSRDVTAVRFLVPSLGEDSGGRVFVGPDADLTRLATYYTEYGKASAALYSHVLRHGNALVQINGKLTDAQAAKYEAALKGL